MIITLPQPIRNNTHVEVAEVAHFPDENRIRVEIHGGTLDMAGTFSRDPDLAAAYRYVPAEQFAAFEAFYAADSWASLPQMTPLEVHVRKILRFIWQQEATSRGIDPTLPA